MQKETLSIKKISINKEKYSRVATSNDLFGTNIIKSSKNSDNDTFEYKRQQEFGERKRIKP